MVALVIAALHDLRQGIPAFTQYSAVLPVDLSGEDVDREDVAKSSFGTLTNDAIDAAFPFAESRSDRRVPARSCPTARRSSCASRCSTTWLVGGTPTVTLPSPIPSISI